MPSTALHPRFPGTIASVIMLLGLLVVATAATSAGAAVPADVRSRQAMETEQTTDSAANATVYVAPGRAWDDLDNSSAIAHHLEDGTLTRRSEPVEDPGVVTVNDTLVLAITLPGLEERLSAAPGENATERMRSLVAGENASLSVVEQNPTTERPAMLADLLAANGTDATRVVAGDGDTAYLVVDVDEVVVEYSSPDNSREKLIDAPYYDRIFRVNVTLEATSATTFFVTQPPEVTVPPAPGSETTLLPAAANATLVGPTNLAPGTAIDVTIVDNETGRELVNSTVTVDDSERFSMTLDTTGMANSTLEVRLAHGSTAFHPTPVVVRSERATLDLSDQEGDGHRVTIDEVVLSHGGVLVVRRNSSEGPIVGQTEVAVGEQSDVVVGVDEALSASRTLVVTAYRDVNANGSFDEGIDESYGASATATYRVEPDENLTATPTATTDGDTGGGTSTHTSVTRDDAPGLGGTATLLALLAVLVVAEYRRKM